jgi:hypothetical protein
VDASISAISHISTNGSIMRSTDAGLQWETVYQCGGDTMIHALAVRPRQFLDPLDERRFLDALRGRGLSGSALAPAELANIGRFLPGFAVLCYPGPSQRNFKKPDSKSFKGQQMLPLKE